MLNRMHKGSFHDPSPEHLDRYMWEIAAPNFRNPGRRYIF